jgi:hypothetical protein
MARAGSAGICGVGYSGQTKLAHRAEGNTYSQHQAGPRISFVAGRGYQHRAVSLSVHLAIQRGGGGEDRRWPKTAVAAAGHQRKRTAAIDVRHRAGYVVSNVTM